MTFSLHCTRTDKFITVNGRPDDYTRQQLDDICYGPTTFSIKVGEALELDIGGRKVGVQGIDASEPTANKAHKVD